MNHQLTLVSLECRILEKMADAEAKAWEALSGYKFWMFGYHAARWVQMNQLLQGKEANPFLDAVKLARAKIDPAQRVSR